MTLHRRGRAALLAALWSASAGCAKPGGRNTSGVEPASLEVRVAGCPVLRRGAAGEPVCEIDEGTSLRMWLPSVARDARIEVRADGARLEAARTPVPSGILLTVKLPGQARELSVETGPVEMRARYRLAMMPRQAVPFLDEVRALRRSGQTSEARRRIEAALADHSSMERGDRRDAGETVRMLASRAQRLGLLARVLRDTAGATREAVARFHEAVQADRAAGLISDELKDRDALAFTLRERLGKHAAARAVLAEAAPLLALEGDAWARDPYSRALIEFDVGNLREALARSHEAVERSTAIGYLNNRISALLEEAEVLLLLGRHPEAIARLDEALAASGGSGDPCMRANAEGYRGWLILLVRPEARRDRDGHALDPVPPLERAAALYRGECRNPEELANVLTDHALAEFERGRMGEARRRLAEADAAAPHMRISLRAWWLGLSARILLAEGKPRDALSLCRQLELLDGEAVLPEGRLEASFVRARVAEALGRIAEAHEAWEATDRLLDAWSRQAPLGGGHQGFIARFQEMELARIDFLLRTRPVAEVALAARRSRARTLSTLSWIDRPSALSPGERAQWERALVDFRAARSRLDELAERDRFRPGRELAAARAARAAEQARLDAALDVALAALHGTETSPAAATRFEPGAPPSEGELVLLFHPLPDGWVGFALSDHGARAVRLGPVDERAPPQMLAGTLLAPFDRDIERARRVRLLASGAVARIDVHALPYRGRPLIATREVTWSLDLPVRATRAAALPGVGAALLVADPLEELPSARAESARFGAALGAERMVVRRLEGREAVHDAVRRALVAPDVTLFHYAGHARFEGRDGWESALPLAAGGWLTLGDVLALERVPPRVVLSGCDTARASDGEFAVGLGLAQAFLLAGAEQVLAASRPVADTAAATIMGEVLLPGAEGRERSLAGDPEHGDLGGRLARAQARLAASGDGSDWAAFRALVR